MNCDPRSFGQARIAGVLRQCWRLLLDATGDSAYRRYVECLGRREPGRPPLGRRAFYLERLDRKYTRPSRCC